MTPAEVCKALGIQDSTLRKYSLLLDKEGVTFERHKNNRRIYTETHVITLKRSLELMQNGDITLEKAIHQAVGELKAQPVIEDKTVMEKPLQRHDSDMTALLLEEIKSLKAEMRERDLLFVEALETMQQKLDRMEKQQQLNAPTPTEEEINAVESPPQAEPEPKRGFFARLFKK